MCCSLKVDFCCLNVSQHKKARTFFMCVWGEKKILNKTTILYSDDTNKVSIWYQYQYIDRSSHLECLSFVLQTYLVSAPVPCGQYGEPQSHPGPGKVSGDGVSEQVHGVLPWQVAGTVGNNFTGYRSAVPLGQLAVATNLIESCGCTFIAAVEWLLSANWPAILCVYEIAYTSNCQDNCTNEHDKRLEGVCVNDSSETTWKTEMAFYLCKETNNCRVLHSKICNTFVSGVSVCIIKY